MEHYSFGSIFLRPIFQRNHLLLSANFFHILMYVDGVGTDHILLPTRKNFHGDIRKTE